VQNFFLYPVISAVDISHSIEKSTLEGLSVTSSTSGFGGFFLTDQPDLTTSARLRVASEFATSAKWSCIEVTSTNGTYICDKWNYICIAPLVFAPVVTVNSLDSNQQIFSKQIWTCNTSDSDCSAVSAVYDQTIHAWAACGVLASPCATETSFTDSFVNGNCRESWSNMSTTWLQRQGDFWAYQDASPVDTAVQSAPWQSALDRGLHTAPGSKLVEWGGTNPFTAQEDQQRWLRAVIVIWCGLIGIAAFTSHWAVPWVRVCLVEAGSNTRCNGLGVVILIYSLTFAKMMSVDTGWGGEWAKGSTIEMANEKSFTTFYVVLLLNPFVLYVTWTLVLDCGLGSGCTYEGDLEHAGEGGEGGEDDHCRLSGSSTSFSSSSADGVALDGVVTVLDGAWEPDDGGGGGGGDVDIGEIDGPLSKAEYNERVVSCPMTRLKLKSVTMSYSFFSQRGYYPDDLSKANQDCYFVNAPFNGDEDFAFFAVLDGHGAKGHLCAQFARDAVQVRSNMHMPVLFDVSHVSR
jgi:hypothetical protein